MKVLGLRGRRVVLAGLWEFSPEAKEEPALRQEELGRFFHSLGLSGRAVAVHVPAEWSFVKSLHFPAMPQAELREALRWELQRSVPYSLQEAIYDYVARPALEGLNVTAAVLERHRAEEHLVPFREAGFKVCAVDLSCLCIQRALGIEAPGNVAVLEIGAQHAEINIYKAGLLKLTRSLEMGTQWMEGELQREGLGPQEAQRLLRQGGAEALAGPLSELLKELVRSMDYYMAEFRERSFASLLLTGGGALNPAVREFFAQGLASAEGLEVKAPNPLEAYQVPDEALKAQGARFTLALGLARRRR